MWSFPISNNQRAYRFNVLGYKGRFFSRMPRRAPELSEGLSPEGYGMEAIRRQRGRKLLLSTLVESEERKEKAASGSRFLWFLSFGDAKERNSLVGARTDF